MFDLYKCVGFSCCIGNSTHDNNSFSLPAICNIQSDLFDKMNGNRGGKLIV
jgi:hypothetical protein